MVNKSLDNVPKINQNSKNRKVTSDFLPGVFRTNTNKRFLNATMDQLIQEPKLNNVYGYVGRQDLSPAYQTTDPYVRETDSYSQFYQLEPGLVINERIAGTNRFKKTNAFNYVDLLNGVALQGGINTNHSRLFSNEYYNYEGFIDFDKLINYGKYYWVPNGPTTLEVNGYDVDNTKPDVVFIEDLSISRPIDPDTTGNLVSNKPVGLVGYNISQFPGKTNPTLNLVRGRTYNFNVAQLGHPFWIQTEPGLGEGVGYQENIFKREVYGVDNNGAEEGTVTFRVPFSDEQFDVESLPLFDNVDLVTDIAYNDIQNVMYEDFIANNTIDGMRSLTQKRIVMINPDPASWGDDVPLEQRYGIWQLNNVDGQLRLGFIKAWPNSTKIFVREGRQYGNVNVIRNSNGLIYKEPFITSKFDTLYYQDGVDENVYGEIRLVTIDPTQATIDVVQRVLGQPSYTSPNNVEFTNGLKVIFRGFVEPAVYADTEFVVEGVGTGIKLVAWENLLTPDPNNPNQGDGFDAQGENFDSLRYDLALNSPLRKDYVVINRSSIDGNAWSRTNRWFHEDVIRYATTFNNSTAPVVLDNAFRGIRPIIEFDANLQLFNHGNKFAGSVTVIDSKVTDLGNQVEGISPYVLIDSNGNYYSDNVALENGTYVIFTQERYQDTRNKIYEVSNIIPHAANIRVKTVLRFAQLGSTQLILTDTDYLYVNMKVTGQGVPSNTIITAIDTLNNIVTVNNELVDVPAGSSVSFNTNNKQVHLTPVHTMQEGETVVALSGATKQNFVYWWHNDSWVYAQQKTSLNQAPLFDIFSISGISFSNTEYFTSSTFAGSKLFGYKESTTGLRDSELGFPLTYRSIGNIGDIVFENFYDTEAFHYSFLNKDQTLSISNGFAHENNVNDLSFKLRNNWVKVLDQSKQYIQKKYIVSENLRNNFLLNVDYKINSQNEKNIFVYVNEVELSYKKDFSLMVQGKNYYVSFAKELIVGDVLVVKIFANPISQENFTLPKNLTENSLNETFDSLTLGQIRNHVQEIADNSLYFVGEAAGSNNLRDIAYKQIPGRILQHSAGVHVSQLFFNNETTNIIQSIDYSRKAYRNFKDRFFSLLGSVDFQNTEDPRACLDQVFDELTSHVTSDQSFYYTDMVATGTKNFIVNQYIISDTNYRKFNVINPFSVATPGYESVLIYQKKFDDITDTIGNQLLINKDYTFDGYVVNIITNLDINDTISVFEYASTKGCTVPATPTKLGLYPKFTPEIFEDDTFIGRRLNVIQGHDGSKTIAFNDFRDNIVLEFEKRVYNNITVNYINDNTSFTSIEPGAFRVTDYSMDEWTLLLSPAFLEWAGSNSVNVFDNLFQNQATSNDPFSFNYYQSLDVLFNDGVPGYWRGIYKYFFDTDRPHTHPWEMFGFSQQPDWWEARYGKAPYTSGNLVLWQDVQIGLIYQHGYDSYIDSRYARPGTLNVIPVDDHGDLIPPLSSVVTTVKPNNVSSSWRFGDQSPQETVWRRSSEYPYAIQIAWALAKPAQYCTWSLNRCDYVRIPLLDQIINKRTGKRAVNLSISDDTQYIPGSNIWIRDRLAGLNVNIQTKFVEIFENLGLNLVYKMSGFTDKSYIEVIAEQASPNSTNTGILVPKENYDLVVSKSSPVGAATYSAVIIKKAGGVFSIFGTDFNRPYFIITPRRMNGNFYNINVSQQTAMVRMDDEDGIQIIPYGQQFTTTQQVVDFLISYGSYLKSTGFLFGDVASGESEIEFHNSTIDWANSAKQFLYWLEQGWDSSIVLSLTPAGTQLSFDTGFGVVDDLTNSYNGVRLTNSDDTVLQTKEYTTSRIGTTFNVILKDPSKGIHLLDLVVVAYEHTLVFDNTTVFNDIIYSPSLGNRQYRMKINGFKTRDWDGSLYAPGFLVNFNDVELWQPVTDYYKGDIVEYKNKYYTAKVFIPGQNKFIENNWMPVNGTLLNKKLIPNMAFNAQQFENFYDVDKFDVNSDADTLARNATGFVPRNYLDDIGLNNISQHKFYLGMIREKGTKAAINAFLRAKLPYIDNNVTIDEQFAIRLGSYGGSNDINDIELSLENANPLNGAYVVELINQNDTRSNMWNSYRPKDLLMKPASYDNNIFSSSESYPMQIGTGGPVYPSDVTSSVYDIQKIYNLSGPSTTDSTAGYGEGSRIWVANDTEGTWNVYRLSGFENIKILNAVAINTTSEIEFTTDIPHGLTFNDNILIKNGTTTGKIEMNLSGFYRVNKVLTANTFRTPIYDGVKIVSGPMYGSLLKIKSVKYNDRSSFAIDTPPGGWRTSDRVWINGLDGNWEVLNRYDNYIISQSLTPVFSGESDNFGNQMDIKSTEDIVVVGAPGKDSGYVYVYNKDLNASWAVAKGISPENSNTSQFGYSVKYNDLDLAIIGAPGSNSGAGLAYIINASNYKIGVNQILNPAGMSAGDQFGYAVASSVDGNWIAIGAPADNTVFIYRYTEITSPITYSYQAESATEFELPQGILGAGLTVDDIKVYINDDMKIPTTDYYISGNNVELNFTPNYSDILTITYESYYQYVTEFSNTENSGNFGSSLSFSKDGSQLAIGAPTLTVVDASGSSYTSMGQVYVYERTIESFIIPTYTETFLTSAQAATLYSVTLDNTAVFPLVYIDGVLDTENTVIDNTVTFMSGDLLRLLSYGSQVTVESNTFRLLETKAISTGQNNLNFGAKVQICPTTCSLYVGAPGFATVNPVTSASINSGALLRYVNEARFYGSLTGIQSNPTTTGGYSTSINGVKITFDGSSIDNRTILDWSPYHDYITDNWIRYNTIIYKPTQNFTSGATFDSTYLTPYQVTINEIVSDINAAKIPGITASKSLRNRLVITSSNELAHNKIVINTTSLGTFLTDVGLTVFKYYQTINSIVDQSTANFGIQFALNNAGDRLVIGATTADNIKFVSLDKGTTTFDAKSTRTFSAYYRSGAAYLYEYQADVNENPIYHGNFAYAQTFNTSSLVSNQYFGTGVLLTNNWAIISSLGDGTKAGTVNTFYNKSGTANWAVLRQQLPDVDSRKITRAYIYNDNTKTLIADLPVIDPEHGIPVPAAAEQIRYILNYDPAIYTNSPNKYSFAVDVRSSWSKEHVGQLWWDTNQIKYTLWNQGSLLDRFNNWGLSIPNSFASVYEWIESDMTPSQWNIEHPLTPSVYTASEIYSTRVVIDPDTLAPFNKYYFWIINNDSNSSKIRRDTALMLQELIANPRKNANQPFVSVIGTNALALFNCNDLIDKDTRLHLTLQNNRYVNPVHNEWTMFDDGSDLGVAREFLDRMNDSLAGIDARGKLVPDPDLSIKERYGLEVRPRQTTFADNFNARGIWINNVNAVFTQYPMALLRDIVSLLEEYDVPPIVDGVEIKFSVDNEIELTYINAGFYNTGDKILVLNDSTVNGWSIRQLQSSDSVSELWKIIQVKTYDLRNYWSYADWYQRTLIASVAVDKIVDYDYEIQSSNPQVGELIKVKNGGNGNWKLVLAQESSFQLVGQQNATIQLNSNLYDNNVAGFGIDSQSFEIIGFAKDNALEFRKIFDIVTDKLLTNELRDDFKIILRAMLDDITNQFKQNDWLMKTSLVNVNNEVRSLNQIPVYVKETTDTVLNFFNEVKPYHTKVKEFISSYKQLDTAQLDAVDFDLPPYYNLNNKRYREPQLGNGIDVVNDINVFDTPLYNIWYNNHKYPVQYIDIADGGHGYRQIDTTVVITGDGTGATAQAFIKNGSIYAIELTDSGKNYTYATVKILGTGTGATAFAKLGHSVARNIKTTIRFDRFTYGTYTKEWAPNTSYALTDLINYNGNVYRIATDANLQDLQSNGIITENTFNFTNLIELKVKVWEPEKPFTKDTIIVYKNVPYVALTDFVSGRYFEYNDNITVTNSLDWEPATYYMADTVISYNGVAYRVLHDFTTPNSFTYDNLLSVYDIARYPGGYFDDAASRVWSYYNPSVGMPGKDLTQVMTGMEYPGVIVKSPTFNQLMGYGFELFERIAYDQRTYDENGLLDVYGDQQIDSNIASYFNDAQLGLRPEDMIVDGSNFVDPSSSYAPEEFIPGMMLDSVDIRVKTLSDYTVSKSPDVVVVSKYADGVTKVYSFDPTVTDTKLPIVGIENITVLNDIAGLQREGVDYTVNWALRYIEFINAPPIPSSVYIIMTGASGQKVMADSEFIGDGQQTEFEIFDAVLENVQQVYVKINGNKVTDWKLAEAGYGTTDPATLGWDGTPVDGTYWDQSYVPVSAVWQPLTDYFVDDFVTYNAATYRVVRAFRSGAEFSDENMMSSQRVIVRFDGPPAAGDLIQIHLFDLSFATKAYSEITTQEVMVGSGYQTGTAGFEIVLNEKVQYSKPWESKVRVSVNGIDLEPTNQAYYAGDGKNKTFSLPNTRNVDVNSVTNSDIVALIDGVVKLNPSEYTVYRNGIDIPSVVFNSSPADGSSIIISNKSTSDYFIFNERSIIIKPSYRLFPNDKIEVTVYSNHDQYDTRCQVFSSLNNNTTSIKVDNYSGWDSIAYDSINYVDETLLTGSIGTIPYAIHHSDLKSGSITTSTVDYGFASNIVGFDNAAWDVNEVTYASSYILNSPLNGTPQVSVNGVVLSILTDYVIANTSTIVFNSQVLSTDVITVYDLYDTLITIVSSYATTTAMDISALKVVVDGIQLNRYTDYTLSNAYSLSFLNTLKISPSATIQVYSLTPVVDPAANFGWDDEFTISIEPAGTIVSLGYDIVGWDTTIWDNERTNTIAAPTYVLSRPVNNINNLRVTFNGAWLQPFYEYVLITPTVMRIDPALGVTSADVVVVTHINEDARQQNIEFRIFKGITETYDYLGISDRTTTLLTQDLLQNDEWINVKDTSVFSFPDPEQSRPGVVFINGERITFYVLDIVNNRLGQLRRGTNGTGAPLVHAAGLRVYDGGNLVEIPSARDKYVIADVPVTIIGKAGNRLTVDEGKLYRQGKVWENMGVGTPSDGKGILNSTTVQATFLKAL